MGECFPMLRPEQDYPKITGTAEINLVKENRGNWHAMITGSGSFAFERIGNAKKGLEVIIVGGGASGAANGGYGGGGYTQAFEVTPERGTVYQAAIGAGGDASGEDGGETSAFGQTVAGGTGGDRVILYMNATVHGVNWGNVYFYSSKSASAVSIGGGYRDVQIKYPLTYTTLNNGTTVIEAYPRGYYRCEVNSSTNVYGAVNGEGGERMVPFDESAVYEPVSGSVGAQSAADAVYRGCGGGGNLQSSTYGKGKAGVVIFRNKRLPRGTLGNFILGADTLAQ